MAGDNQAALKLHARVGFKPERMLRDYYGAGHHAWHMKASLAHMPRPSVWATAG
jgi:ribosomal protein S18 acetylase RimI-like enzyme